MENEIQIRETLAKKLRSFSDISEITPNDWAKIVLLIHGLCKPFFQLINPDIYVQTDVRMWIFHHNTKDFLKIEELFCTKYCTMQYLHQHKEMLRDNLTLYTKCLGLLLYYRLPDPQSEIDQKYIASGGNHEHDDSYESFLITRSGDLVYTKINYGNRSHFPSKIIIPTEEELTSIFIECLEIKILGNTPYLLPQLLLNQLIRDTKTMIEKYENHIAWEKAESRKKSFDELLFPLITLDRK